MPGKSKRIEQQFAALIGDAEDHIQNARVEAREMIEEADKANRFGGALIAEWDRRCDEAAQERMNGVMMRMTALLADKFSGDAGDG